MSQSSEELHKQIVEYYTDESRGEPRPMLYFDNIDNEYTVGQVKKWFLLPEEKERKSLEIFEEEGRIKLTVTLEKRKWGERRSNPGARFLIIVMSKLNEMNLHLTDDAVRELKKAFLHVKRAIEIMDKERGRPFLYLTRFQGAFADLQEYFDELPGDLCKELDDELPDIEPGRLSIYNIFNDDNYLENNFYAPKNKCEDFIAKINIKNNRIAILEKVQGQWSAVGKNTISIKSIEKMVDFISALNFWEHPINLDTESLSSEVKIALQNMIVYGGKLMAEVEPADRDEALTNKIDATIDFIRTVLSSENLTTDSIKDAYQKFERQDVNRGRRFYLARSFFKGKRYDKGEKGLSRLGKLVKSTSGELAFNFLRAVGKAEHADPGAEDSDYSSSSSM